MDRREEQMKMKQLLVDAITLLCKSGMRYEKKFCIEALIGITLDDNDVVLININEMIDTDEGASFEESTIRTRQSSNRRNNSNRNQRNSFKSETPIKTEYDHSDEIESNLNENFQNNLYNQVDPTCSTSNFNDQYQNQCQNDISQNYYPSDNANNMNDSNFITEATDETDDCFFVKEDQNDNNENWDQQNANLGNNFNMGSNKRQRFNQTPYTQPTRRIRGRGRSGWRSSSGQSRLKFHSAQQQQNVNFTASDNMADEQVYNNNSCIDIPNLSQMLDTKESLSPSSTLHAIPTTFNDTQLLTSQTSHSTSTSVSATLSSRSNDDNKINVYNNNNSNIGGNNKAKPPCPYCAKVFCSFQALRGHIDGLHLNKKSYRCFDCGESFKWRTDLCKHRRNMCPYRIQLASSC